MRSGSSTTCGCCISWPGTYYWGAGCPVGSLKNLMDGPNATPHSVAAILPSMAQAFHHGKEINRAEALAALLGGRRRALGLANHHMDRQRGGLQHPQERHEPFVAIPRPASAVPLSDAPLAWQHLGGAVCRFPRISQDPGNPSQNWGPGSPAS